MRCARLLGRLGTGVVLRIARGRRPRLIVALALAAALAGTTPAYAGTFNVPHETTGGQRAISDELDRRIDAAPAGSVIRLATYSLQDPDSAARLLAAYRRHAQVRLLLDAPHRGVEWDKLVAVLGADMRRSSWARLCYQSCLGAPVATSHLHAKFTTFSATGSARQVVVLSSANLSFNQIEEGANNAYTIAGNAGMYAAFNRYFDDMAAGSAGRRQPNYYRSVTSGPYSVNFLPAAPGRRNPVLDLLDRISCTGGTQVTIAMYRLFRADVARRVWQLDDAGCVVRLLYTEIDAIGVMPVPGSTPRGSHPAWSELTRPGGHHGGISMRESTYHYTDYAGKVHWAYSHQKYVLVDGTFDGRAHQKVLITGSVNWTWSGAYTNDEVMLVAHDAAGYASYMRNFDAMVAASRTPLYTSCTRLHAVFRYGVARPGARRPRASAVPRSDELTYAVSKGLDTDRDGVSCPVPASRLTAAVDHRQIRPRSPVVVSGALGRASLASGRYAAYGGQRVELQVRATTGPFHTVRTAVSSSSGGLRTAVTQWASGCWRWVYPGSGGAGPASAAPACVIVR
jgi:PLD-like domain